MKTKTETKKNNKKYKINCKNHTAVTRPMLYFTTKPLHPLKSKLNMVFSQQLYMQQLTSYMKYMK